MKHFMQPKNAILRENNPSLESPSSSNPSSLKRKSTRKQKSSTKENAPPPDLYALPDSSPSPSFSGKPSPAAAGKMRSPLPPRPPPSNPLKRKLNMETVPENGLPGFSDSGVNVVVRMRPLNKDEEEGEMIVQKNSSDSLTILGQTFTFDSVADTESTQLDIFQLVGAPLVENCLAGLNSSVFAYGQTGSGKTYTMWGPANALLEENLSSDQQGLTPRIFERLFARINEEQIKHADKLMYQCRCSFLEIYNEQITDLLDPSQKNLQIREDVKTGVYVENLTEECVCTTKDVTQLLIKGLSNRRTGATSINAESSRSHSVFTCVVESRCKSMADGLSSFKTSRINLVDLAGSERQKLTGAAGERLKEAGNINRSLSQLGNLINILAEVSQTGKQRHIPYRDSRLTFLLQESLGGNAKLAMVCAISPSQSCKSETFSTLRFAQRAKAIKNKAVVNEVMQDDVNFLREVIRQLKDELLRMKANGNETDPNGGYSTGWNARRSLNLLKFSLNRPMTLPRIDDDSDEEMEIVEEADQVSLQSAGSEENNTMDVSKVASKEGTDGEPQPNISGSACVEEQVSEDTDVNMEEEISEKVDKHEIISVDFEEPVTNTADCSMANVLNHHDSIEGNDGDNSIHSLVNTREKNYSGQCPEECLTPSINTLLNDESLSMPVVDGHVSPSLQSASQVSADIVPEDTPSKTQISLGDGMDPSNLSIVPCDVSPVLKSPTPSVSPRVNDSRKSLRTSSVLTASQRDFGDVNKPSSEAVSLSFAKPSKSSYSNALSTQTSKNYFKPTEHLAASLHRGLEIIDGHRQSSVLRRSSFRFSCKPSDIKPILPVDKVDVGLQTSFEENELLEEDLMIRLCSKCKGRNSQHELKDGNDRADLQLVPVDVSQCAEKPKKQVPKAVEKVLAGAIRREMALEEVCNKQASEVVQLNRLVQQYKHERECNAIIGQTREDKIVRLESLMDGILPTEEFMEDELVSLTNEHKLLKEKYENHPEVLRTKIELKRVEDELERYRNFFDMGERDVLLEEIHDLRSQLQYYIDSSPADRRRGPLLQLTYSCERSVASPLCTILESAEGSAEQKLEQERIRWTEAESKWISLAEELRAELEASRSVAEKRKQELDLEKKCSEELKEAMQMAMEGHARMLEQYADLEEKHIHLLMRHRKIQDGIDDVKKAAARAGVRGAESKFINALAAEISALKVEREKERRYLRDENKGLQAQLRDTAEAVQAAGELLVRLKEAEETIAAAQKQAMDAEQETEKAYKQIDKLKKKHEKELSTLNQLLEESRLPKEAFRPPPYDNSDMTKYDAVEPPHSTGDQQWREEFEPFYNVEDGEISKLAEPSSWFSGYDRCNI
ncbi:kinesin-like protein KIN-12B [Cornus florida]|uniref:kinesin-like protein KIN-12B n=1 Tax=Cornus florida TaxID=4283 RepID=UPI002898D216|nr:kinesin-like protein KIN-12B [Cornus florida]